MGAYRKGLCRNALNLFEEYGQVLENNIRLLEIVDRLVLAPETVTLGEVDTLVMTLLHSGVPPRQQTFWQQYTKDLEAA